MSTFILIFMGIVTLAALVFGVAMIVFYKRKQGESVSLQEQIRQSRATVSDLKKQIESIAPQLKAEVDKYEKTKVASQHLIDLEGRESEMRENIVRFSKRIEALTQEALSKDKENKELSSQLNEIKLDISLYSPVLDLTNVGFFEEPEYLFETSELFKDQIKIIREKQKEMIKGKTAVSLPDTVAVTTNNKYARKILQDQSKLMLKTFNIDCDRLIGAVKPSNYEKTLERIDKVATDVEKNSLSLACGFDTKYVELKYKECELQYQFKLKQEREREEQRIIKEQIREEQKAVREFERAVAKAQKEEEIYQAALDEAQKQLSVAGDAEKNKLQAKVEKLMQQLKEAEENGRRAKSLAEQTRRGHVYVISNIGSFGDEVYKIGLTRRLEPLDRVKELGDASVPFPFDVHAMIYSEDAPALEARLHREFTHNRVNVVNTRKEFFHIELESIKGKVEEIFGNNVEFRMTAIAQEYYESKKLRSAV